MGVVYLALDTHLDRRVAIKVLSPNALSNAERKRRFVQEAKAALDLSPFLRQTVKTQISSNGELSHGIVS